MDYIQDARIVIDEKNESYNIVLDVLAMLNGSSYGIQEVYYTVSNFGNGNVTEIDTFINSTIGGETNE
mgnify:FL=1